MAESSDSKPKYRPPNARGGGNAMPNRSWGSNNQSSSSFRSSNAPTNSRWDRSNEQDTFQRQERRNTGFQRDRGDRSNVFSSSSRRRFDNVPAPVISSRNATFDISSLDTGAKRKETRPQVKKISTRPSYKKLAREAVSGIIFKSVKDYLSLFQSRVILETIEKQLKYQDYEVELFTTLFDRTKGLELRNKKSVLSLFSTLLQNNLITNSSIAQALEEIASRSNKRLFKQTFKFFESGGIFDSVDFSQQLLEQVTPVRVLLESSESFISAVVSNQVNENSVDSFATGLKELSLDVDEVQVVLIKLLNRYLTAHYLILKKETEQKQHLVSFLKNIVGVGESEGKEEIENKLQLQTELLYALQDVFHADGFELSGDKESVFERVVFSLYESEVVNEEALSYWKDDKFRNLTQLSETQRESKRLAISHCVSLLDIILLQEEEEETPEEDLED